MTLRWNGSGWQRAAGATRGHRGLVGGVAVGERKVLGVGYYRPFGADDDSALVPMSGRVSGAAWKDLDVPRPPGSRATLTDVASLGGNDAWAVGTRLDGGRLRAWAARLDGSRWTRSEPSTKGGSGLLAIDRAPSGELWAVGWQEQRAGQQRPYVATLQRGRWRSVAPPDLPDGTAVITDVEMHDAREDGPSALFWRADRHMAFLLRWDGRRWTRRPLPWANEVAAVPRSVSAGDDGRIWIAGTQTANEQRGRAASWPAGPATAGRSMSSVCPPMSARRSWTWPPRRRAPSPPPTWVPRCSSSIPARLPRHRPPTPRRRRTRRARASRSAT
jgi:hypothetical protein